jgi:hypothetical protein
MLSFLLLDLSGRHELRWPFEALAGTAIAAMALLWFRRARQRAEATEETPAGQAAMEEPQAEAAPENAGTLQSRAALCIRGLLLLNLKPHDRLEHIETAPPLGPREAVERAVRAAAPGIEFDPAGRAELRGSGHRLSIDVGRDDPVAAAVAAAEGDAGIEMLRSLVQTQGWRMYAARAGVFVEPDTLDLFALPDDRPLP